MTDDDRAARHLAVYPSGPGARKALAEQFRLVRLEERAEIAGWIEANLKLGKLADHIQSGKCTAKGGA